MSGARFSSLQVPIQAPPTLSGFVGIVGIYVGYSTVDSFGWGFDLLAALGIRDLRGVHRHPGRSITAE